jgi:hypothetical protein
MYEDHIRQCNIVFASGDAIKASKSKYCEENDALRIEMNARQPQSVRNYTENGYKKIRTPPELFSLIKDFWDANRNKSETEWNSVTVYQNSWNAPSEMVHLAREEFGGSNNLQKKIFDNAKPILEEWTHHYLEPVSLWGIRIYRNSSVLVPHVDRMPLIISAISEYGIFYSCWNVIGLLHSILSLIVQCLDFSWIYIIVQVDQDVEEPW